MIPARTTIAVPFLIVMENRNIQGGFQPFLNFKAAGSADIFQVDSSESREPSRLPP